MTQDAVDTSNLLDVLRETVELALARNEAVVKLRHVRDLSAYVGPGEVLVGADGLAREGWLSAGAFWGRDAMHFQATQ